MRIASGSAEMPVAAPEINLRKILVFWLPMASTWLMMAAEGPFLTAVIARMAEPKYNLAAFGIAFSLAVLTEAPVVMILSASTALVKDRPGFLRLRNFTYAMNGAVVMPRRRLEVTGRLC